MFSSTNANSLRITTRQTFSRSLVNEYYSLNEVPLESSKESVIPVTPDVSEEILLRWVLLKNPTDLRKQRSLSLTAIWLTGCL